MYLSRLPQVGINLKYAKCLLCIPRHDLHSPTDSLLSSNKKNLLSRQRDEEDGREREKIRELTF